MEPRTNIGIICNHHGDQRQADWQKNNKKVMFKPGDMVKMGFSIDGSPEKHEHMWVSITKCSKKQNSFEGVLENDPVLIKGLYYGAKVKFKRTEISQHTIKPTYHLN